MRRHEAAVRTLLISLAAAMVACTSPIEETPLPKVPDLPIEECAVPLPDASNIPEQLEKACDQRGDARLTAMSDERIRLTSELGLPPGRYALPETAEPTQLVVMFHGHQNDSCSWRNHLRSVADLGAIAVSMDYTGQIDKETEEFGFIRNWGWFVRNGADDSILAAQYFLDKYPSITEVFNYGASMGANVAGYAAYKSDAVRSDCSALWDYWVQVEGVHNVTEEYTGAKTLAASGNGAAGQAALEIEEENGGTLEEQPEAYSEITNTLHAESLAYLKGAVLTHGNVDQTVPVDQSRQMADQLRANGVPTHLYIVNGSDHVWEGDGDATVMRLGLEELYRLMDGGEVSDGETPVVQD